MFPSTWIGQPTLAWSAAAAAAPAAAAAAAAVPDFLRLLPKAAGVASAALLLPKALARTAAKGGSKRTRAQYA